MFVKGGKGGPGRPKNARNVIAGDVKRLMLEAVEKTGDNGRDGVRGYLQMLAREQPALMGAAVLRSFVPAAKEDAPAEGGATIELVMGMVPRGMFILGETEVRAVEEDLARR